MTLGQRIQQIRIAHALSQEEFGEKLGTTRQTVSRWELDQTCPEIEKIVWMSKLFSVTTDSILKDGISTFDTDMDTFTCGIYRSAKSEIVETEKFSLVYYCNSDKSVLGTKLYAGFEEKKFLVAICERDQKLKLTKYAYSTETDETISNDDCLCSLLGESYDDSIKASMRCLESFSVDHARKKLPRVSEAGIANCLRLWRTGSSYRANVDSFYFFLCTDQTEYIFSIRVKDENIYCGASNNIAFELGVFGGGQYFRIRNYKDNTESFCRFFCDFSHESHSTMIPTEKCELGKCVPTNQGYMVCKALYR